jgi:hypothetical protein
MIGAGSFEASLPIDKSWLLFLFACQFKTLIQYVEYEVEFPR